MSELMAEPRYRLLVLKNIRYTMSRYADVDLSKLTEIDVEIDELEVMVKLESNLDIDE